MAVTNYLTSFRRAHPPDRRAHPPDEDGWIFGACYRELERYGQNAESPDPKQTARKVLLAVRSPKLFSWPWLFYRDSFFTAVEFTPWIRGSYKEVYRALWLNLSQRTVQMVALLCLRSDVIGGCGSGEALSPKDRKMILNEVEFMRRFQSHPMRGQVSILHVQTPPCVQEPSCVHEGDPKLPQIVAVQPLYATDCLHLMRRVCEKKPQEVSDFFRHQWRSLQYQLLQCLYRLHRRGIVHRDIKPDNFLIHCDPPLQDMKFDSPKAQITAVLTDFAFAMDLTHSVDLCWGVCGSPMYFSPEYAAILSNAEMGIFSSPQEKLLSIQRTTTTRLDVWSLGIFFLQVEDNALFNKIVEPRTRNLCLRLYSIYYEAERIAGFPRPKNRDSILHLIWEMLQPLPSQRVSSREALEKLASIQMQEVDRDADGSSQKEFER